MQDCFDRLCFECNIREGRLIQWCGHEIFLCDMCYLDEKYTVESESDNERHFT